METRRWTNPSQPQTLYIATFLLYFEAVLSVLGFNPFAFLLAVGQAGAAFGIANEKRWGYYLGVLVAGLAILPLALAIVFNGPGVLFSLNLILYFLFPVALFALLLHPMSREYQKIWFN
jgi:uncharacterized membrane protein (DUF2068 family)